jgi:acetyltransferase
MLYQIHRYPAELIDVVRLDGGRRLVIRPVLPQDEELTSAFFGSLTAAARYDRFMSPMRSLPPELVKRFTNIDYSDHLALVAEVFEGGREVVVAEARYARLASDPTVAEFAVSVAERWQGNGLAKLLLAKLVCRAATSGIRRIVGETLATNARMLHLARKAGFAASASPEVRGVMLLEKAIETEPAAMPWCGADAGSRILRSRAIPDDKRGSYRMPRRSEAEPR